MHGNILPAAPAGQAAPRLTDLAEAIRAARAAAAAAFANGLDHVREVGDKLKIAKQMTGHGRWGEFLKACDINDRTARQYIQFAELAAKTAPGTDLTGLSIKAAIKLLSPPKATPPKSPVAPKAVTKVETAPGNGKRTTHADIIEAWLAASPSDRTKAIDSIGLDAILAALPPAWLALLADRLADRQETTTPDSVDPAPIPPDLSISTFLDRRVPGSPVAVEEEPPVVVKEEPLVAITPTEAPKLKSKPVPQVSKCYQAAHHDPWPSNWKKLNADALEEAIRDVQIFGVNHRLEDRHQAHLKKMRGRLAELRATEAATARVMS